MAPNEDFGAAMARALLQGVVLHRDLEKIRAHIVWADGAPDAEIEVILNLHGHRIVGERLEKNWLSDAAPRFPVNTRSSLLANPRPKRYFP